MPELVIDNRKIEVPEGTPVIEAAERLGIMIPRFCFHPALGSVGACRVCAVKFEEGPIKGIEMSCMVNAADGMRVSTDHPDAVDFRRQVIEWLMLHHPHDCPVCDEGGQCLLQDMTVSGNHGLRRYAGPKRTHLDQDLGPLVQHEMNRCIQCYRCVRFYREYAGYQDLGVMGIGSRVYFGRVASGTLESPFSGNLIDICPTGVFTDKPSRFIGRRWDFTRRESICTHCALGCHVTTSVHQRKVVRQEARFNEAINGHFICDRGRYGYGYANRAGRPLTARVFDRQAAVPDALLAAHEILTRTADQSGFQALALVAGTRSGMETLLGVQALCRRQGWPAPVFWTDARQAAIMNAMAAHYDPELAAEAMDLEKADLILGLGVEPLGQAPMLVPALRHAAQEGHPVYLAYPGPLDLPFEFVHLVDPPAGHAPFLETLLQILGQPEDQAAQEPEDPSAPAVIAGGLRRAKHPVILVGSDVAGPRIVALAADLVRTLGPDRARMMMTAPGANFMGAALVDEAGGHFTDILAGIEAGEIKVLALVECDPIWDFADRRRVEKALDKLENLIVLDHLDSMAARKASVLIPTRTVFEAGGTFVNHAGRIQQAPALFAGGLPISRTGGGDHPPREFSHDIPGGGLPAAWEAVAYLADPRNPESVSTGEIQKILDAPAHPAKQDVVRAGPKHPATIPEFGTALPDSAPDQGFRLLLAEAVIGTEILSSHADCLAELAPEPLLYLSAQDANELRLTPGMHIRLHTGKGELALRAAVSPKMASGFLALAKSQALDWRIFDDLQPVVAKKDIEPTGEQNI